jgi:hypothetical protein
MASHSYPNLLQRCGNHFAILNGNYDISADQRAAAVSRNGHSF